MHIIIIIIMHHTLSRTMHAVSPLKLGDQDQGKYRVKTQEYQVKASEHYINQQYQQLPT